MFLRGEQQRIKELITTANVPEGIFTRAADLEQIRDRIAIRLQNLYEQSSKITLKFFSDIVNSPDPALRVNVVKALMTIATLETLNMLFELNNDKDEKVKREVVKALKQLKVQFQEGKLSIEEYKQKIVELLNEELKHGEWIF
ncbi:MAG: HEAT repeat domain-containing protein [Elusimicrobiota bacterium]|nr:HEAT repeat domain-containing protein [Elusimicrobiota bacterium]